MPDSKKIASYLSFTLLEISLFVVNSNIYFLYTMPTPTPTPSTSTTSTSTTSTTSTSTTANTTTHFVIFNP